MECQFDTAPMAMAIAMVAMQGMVTVVTLVTGHMATAMGTIIAITTVITTAMHIADQVVMSGM
ncbi:hypothetical protein J3B02_003377, partial [Coemansia erecta]